MSWLRVFLLIVLAAPAMASAAAALLAQGGRFSAWLDVLTHFAPLYLGVGVATLVLGLGFGRAGMAWIGAPAVVAILGAAALMAPDFAAKSGQASHQGPRLTVVQFNAWGGNARPDAAAAWILAQQPDIVVLEEGGFVGRRLLTSGAFEIVCPGGYAAIYSRFPVISRDCPPDPDDGSKALVSKAVVAGPMGDFAVFGVHRPWPVRFAKDRQQTGLLHRMVKAGPADRTLLVGDFNSTPWSFARRREDAGLGLIRRTRALFTWPAERVSHNRLPALVPLFPIDHVYAGPGWATVEVRRGPRLGSDHYPVVAVLAPKLSGGPRRVTTPGVKHRGPVV